MLTAIKLFFSSLNLKNITLYALVLAIILSLLMYLLWQNEKTSHRLTELKLDTLVQTLEKNNRENDRLDKIRTQQYDALEKQYNLVKVERDKIKEGLQNEINRTGSLLNSIRLLKNNSSGGGLPKDEISSELPSEISRECNTTIAQLIDAGKSCANDYNTLYDAWMIQCDTFGCQ